MSKIFTFKDSIPLFLRSGNVYQFQGGVLPIMGKLNVILCSE